MAPAAMEPESNQYEHARTSFWDDFDADPAASPGADSARESSAAATPGLLTADYPGPGSGRKHLCKFAGWNLPEHHEKHWQNPANSIAGLDLLMEQLARLQREVSSANAEKEQLRRVLGEQMADFEDSLQEQLILQGSSAAAEKEGLHGRVEGQCQEARWVVSSNNEKKV
eukprot:s670_g10.t2